ncbi:MAG TPA: tripartite tricarboxylate transporter substrate-binding protein, partial [Burkholderiales bacterium]|nr:tripartite tricarboxylate transporter substrate-binding protein [Burkholderiales bacterium]
GQIPLCFLSTVASLPHVKAGRVRALGISGRSRSPVVPEVQTIAEGGVPGFEFYLWQAMIVPAGIPRSIMTRLNSEVNAALNHAESKERLVSLGAEPTPSTPQQADAHIRAEIERWMKTLKPPR